MDFDHRVLRPWSRNPCFYEVVQESDSDVPAREGPARPLAIELWKYRFPLQPDRLAALREQLRAIPGWLEQGRRNLVEEARDLFPRRAHQARRGRPAVDAGEARRRAPSGSRA